MLNYKNLLIIRITRRVTDEDTIKVWIDLCSKWSYVHTIWSHSSLQIIIIFVSSP